MKTILKSALSCLLLCLSITLAAQRNKNVESSLLDAVTFYDSGNYTEAEKLLKPLAAAAPDNDAVMYYLALCTSAQGDIETASAYMSEAVRLDPSNFSYKDRLARMYAASSQFEAAIAIYESLIKDFPTKTDLYYTLAQLYARENKGEEVLSTLDEIEAVSGKDEVVTLAKYDVLMRMQRNEDAYKVLESYNDQYSSSQILSAMGDYNLNQFNDTLAYKCYSEALSYESDNGQALVGLSEVYRLRRDYPNYFATINGFLSSASLPLESKTHYIQTLLQHVDPQFIKSFKANLDLLVETYREQAPSDSVVLQTAGSYFYNTGRSDKAGELLYSCCNLYPGSLSSRAMYVQVLAGDEKWEALFDAAEQAYRDFPDEIAFLQMKTSAEYSLERYDELVKDCGRIIAAAPHDTSAVLSSLSAIGDVYHMMNEPAKAWAAYEKALKMDPAYLPVLNNYAYYLSLMGKKMKKAYAMSKITVEAEPDNATYLDTFGWILYLQGKAVEAKPFFKHAMLYGGKDSVTVLDHYAEVLYALGEYDLAKVYWNLAKNKNADGTVPDLDERVQKRLDAISK